MTTLGFRKSHSSSWHLCPHPGRPGRGGGLEDGRLRGVTLGFRWALFGGAVWEDSCIFTFSLRNDPNTLGFW